MGIGRLAERMARPKLTLGTIVQEPCAFREAVRKTVALVIAPFLDLAQGPHKKKALGAQGTAERKNPAGGALPADLPGFASTESL